MRAEGCGSRCVKRFTLTISAVSARNSSSSRNSSACRGSWLSRITATITARSLQSGTASEFGVIFLFSVKVVHLILNSHIVPQHAAGKVLPAGSKHYATKRVSCFRRIPYLLNCHAEHSQLKPHTPGQFCTRKSTGSVYLTRTAWLRCLPGLHFGDLFSTRMASSESDRSGDCNTSILVRRPSLSITNERTTRP